MRDINLTLENDVLPRLRKFEVCYTGTSKRYPSGINQIEAMQADIDVMKNVIREHSRRGSFPLPAGFFLIQFPIIFIRIILFYIPVRKLQLPKIHTDSLTRPFPLSRGFFCQSL